MFYEFRTYTCTPGKLPVVLKRFETTTLALFEKHGIKRITPLMTVGVGEDNSQIKYVVQWESHEQRDKAWAAFRADPDWHKAVAESEQAGPTVAKITNELLIAAPFSLK
jgi:heme-degrading monooxygenase HmoA